MEYKDVNKAVHLARVIRVSDEILEAIEKGEGYRFIALEICGGGKPPLRLSFDIGKSSGAETLIDTVQYIRESAAEDLGKI